MSETAALAPEPVSAPVPIGTRVSLDADARFYGEDLVAGGAPWRLLRLSRASRAVVERWRRGDDVGAGEGRFARTLIQQGILHPHHPAIPAVDDVDVVIPVHDEIARLGPLLASLRGLHVTVVDDASVDAGLIEECTSRFDVDLVRLEMNLGPGGARNEGLAATSRPFVWFIDVDVDVDEPFDVLARLRGALEDPLVAAAAPRVRGRTGSTRRDSFEERFGPLDMGPNPGIVTPGGAIGFIPGACLLARRSALGDGFDIAMRVGEDVDLVWRLHDRGWLVRYEPDVVVTHYARRTWPLWWRQRVGYGESTSALAQRHGQRVAPLRADAWTLVAWGGVLARAPWLSGRIIRVARNRLVERIGESDEDAVSVANALIGRSMVRSAGPMARALVRTYGPLLLVASVHPKLRRRALAVLALGIAWRCRHQRPHPADLPLLLADDLAYSVGVAKGALADRSLAALTPHITPSSIGLRDVLGLARPPANA